MKSLDYNGQQTAFDLSAESRAFARSTDPATSFAAARAVERTLPVLEQSVLGALSAVGSYGATAYEISEALDVPTGSVTPRLRPLERKGLVERTDLRRLGPRGRVGSTVWRIVR